MDAEMNIDKATLDELLSLVHAHTENCVYAIEAEEPHFSDFDRQSIRRAFNFFGRNVVENILAHDDGMDAELAELVRVKNRAVAMALTGNTMSRKGVALVKRHLNWLAVDVSVCVLGHLPSDYSKAADKFFEAQK
jgi:hypothetical protein